ncbi:MAG TPA: GAF domain-containing protein [Geothrix sp.]|nr:GAF domain-containing protein [Geothrix sp.]
MSQTSLSRHRTKAGEHLAAMADLLGKHRNEPAKIFELGLSLLVERLGADQALLTRVSGLGHEVFWWALAEGASMEGLFEAPEKGFSNWVMEHPDRPLVIRNAATETRWRKHSGRTELGIQAYAGVVLRDAKGVLGTLCVQHSKPHVFRPEDVGLLCVFAHLIERLLETENLKSELHAALDALELSSAVVEDSALQSARSGLPNRHYLEIWLRSALFLARRRKEPMAIALWSQPMVLGTKDRLEATSTHLRGEDLLVELSADRYLLLMPHTNREGAEHLLERLRETLGRHPTGATVWHTENDDMTLKSTLARASKAFNDATREGSALLWNPR